MDFNCKATIFDRQSLRKGELMKQKDHLFLSFFQDSLQGDSTVGYDSRECLLFLEFLYVTNATFFRVFIPRLTNSCSERLHSISDMILITANVNIFTL